MVVAVLYETQPSKYVHFVGWYIYTKRSRLSFDIFGAPGGVDIDRSLTDFRKHPKAPILVKIEKNGATKDYTLYFSASPHETLTIWFTLFLLCRQSPIPSGGRIRVCTQCWKPLYYGFFFTIPQKKNPKTPSFYLIKILRCTIAIFTKKKRAKWNRQEKLDSYTFSSQKLKVYEK